MNRQNPPAAWALILIAALPACSAGLTPGAPQGAIPPDSGAWRVFRGAADASAVAFVDAHTLVVADDEDNTLRLYDAAAGGAPRAEIDLSEFLGTGGDAESDIEAAARVGDRVYWISSHARDRKGRFREERRRFFATEIAHERGGTTVRPFGRPCTTLLEGLLAALEGTEPGLALAAAAGVDGPGTPYRRDRGRAPGAGGLNIEALAASADGATLFIGFRSPLAEVGGVARAIVVPLVNAAQVIEASQRPSFGAPLTWDLGGRGLRDMARLAEGDGYVLLAGSVGDRSDFALYRWSGAADEAPRLLSASEPAGFEGQPEALTPVPGTSRLLLLSDDGSLLVKVAPGECERGETRADGRCPNKRLADPSRRTFRGFEISP